MKLFLAGADFRHHQEMMFMANHPNYLTTFFKHQKGFTDSFLKWYRKTDQCGAQWIMDSGLFTMMFGAGSGESYNEKDLLEYTYNYLNQIKKNKLQSHNCRDGCSQSIRIRKAKKI